MGYHHRPLAPALVPEEQLLIQCSRVTLTPEDKERAAALLRGPLNWQYILEVSIRHGIAPLFYHGLQQLSSHIDIALWVPASALDELCRLHEGTGARNRRLYRAVGEIVTTCDSAGAATMGLKDLQLAREVFPDIGLRPVGALGLLIHQKDYHKVSGGLRELGFLPLPQTEMPFTLKYSCGHQFRRPTDNVWVDLQWNITQREWDVYREGSFSFDVARLWSRAVKLTVDNYRLLVPSPEDTLFHLCLHLEGRQYREFILFCDIAELLRSYESRLDWDSFVRLTKEYKAESPVYYALRLTQQLFDLSLPSSLLRQLDPLYNQAHLFGPLFGNLTDLHLSLDDIRLAGTPPRSVMRKFETAVRVQAAGAMQGFKELDALASTFIKNGGTTLIPGGDAPEKIFPDPSLRPFGTVSLCILADDEYRMHQTLHTRGFQPQSGSDSAVYHKTCEFVSADPALSRRPVDVRLSVKIERDLATILPATKTTGGKKYTALKTLRAKFGGKQTSPTTLPLEVRLLALSPEDAFLWLCVRLGEQQPDRLFHLCNLLEFFRRSPRPLSWNTVVTTARRLNIRQTVAEAVAIASAFLPHKQCSPEVLDLLGTSAEHPQILEWARYGPDDLVRHTGPKKPFYYLFNLLSIEGKAEKLKYVVSSVLGRPGRQPLLPALLREFTHRAVASFRQKPLTTRDFAYWVEYE